MPRRRDVLLRVANVNPDSVTTHSDRVLYSAIGIFVLLYFVYATVGGAAFVDASANYTHPWWQWLVGPLVAIGVVAYDRAVVGRVAISYQNLDSADPSHLLKRPTLGLYLGRVGLALLFAVIITEPLMLARYRGEIDAYLNRVHNEQIVAMSSSGALSAYDQRLAYLKQREAEDDAAVARLTTQAVAKRRDARALYQQALQDSLGDGISRKAGCPAGGDCDKLVRRSRALDDQAAALDRQSAVLRAGQKAGRDARTGEMVSLTRLIADQREQNAAAIRADAGFGARTQAMAHLVTSDFWGIGVFYLGIALLLVALDCAAVGLKFVSRGNAYERTEARLAREREHAALIAYERGVADARVYGEATMRVVASGVDAAARDEELTEMAADRARARLRDNLGGYKARSRAVPNPLPAALSTQPGGQSSSQPSGPAAGPPERPVDRLANQKPVRT